MPPFPGAEKGKCVNHESWFHHAPTFSPPLKTFEGPINHFSHSTMRYAFFDPDFSRIEFEFKSCALSRVRMRIFIPDLLLNYEWKARKNKIGAKKKKIDRSFEKSIWIISIQWWDFIGFYILFALWLVER